LTPKAAVDWRDRGRHTDVTGRPAIAIVAIGSGLTGWVIERDGPRLEVLGDWLDAILRSTTPTTSSLHHRRGKQCLPAFPLSTHSS
jgi:hypothetical protein